MPRQKFLILRLVFKQAGHGSALGGKLTLVQIFKTSQEVGKCGGFASPTGKGRAHGHELFGPFRENNFLRRKLQGFNKALPQLG